MKEPVYVKQGNFPSTKGIGKNHLMVREALFPIPTLESQTRPQQERSCSPQSGPGNEMHGSNLLLPRQRLSQASSYKKQEQILAQICVENLEKRSWERKETKELKPNTRLGSLGTHKSSGG